MIETTLAQLTLNITDGKHGDCVNESDSGYYFISCKDITNGNVNYENARQITKKDFLETHKRTMLEPDDILVTNSGTIGRMAFVKDTPLTYRTTFQKSVAIVKPDSNKILPRYLYYLLQYCVEDFVNQSNGAAQKNLLLSTMRAFNLKYHSSKEKQKRISDILSAYDDLIENNQKQINLLEEAAQRLYKEWFVDLHFPGYENTPIIDGIPQGWNVRKLETFGEIITGKTPSTAKESYYNGDIPFVKIPDMHSTIYPIITESKLSEEGANTQKNKFIPKDSLMVSCIATVGLVNIAVQECQTNQQINSIILNDVRDLYYLYFSTKGLKMLLAGVGSNGATMTNVNKSKFANVEILYPTIELCEQFYDFCKPIFENILILSKSTIELKNSRDQLLPKLMSGELEV